MWPGQARKPRIAPAPRSGTPYASWLSPGAMWEDFRGSISPAVEAQPLTISPAVETQPLWPGCGLVGRASRESHL